jgi:trafficking protein particle complex subunit 8
VSLFLSLFFRGCGGLNRVFSRTFLPLPYHGRLTFRGVIPSLQSVVVQPKVWFTRAGSYELGGWTLETEIINTVDVADPTKSTRKRRYLQKPQLSDAMCLIICDARTS